MPRELRVWADESSAVSAWEVIFPTGRFSILISPELSRGFSGEGQMLQRLAGNESADALPAVKAALRWQARIDPDDVGARAGLQTKPGRIGPGHARQPRPGRLRPGPRRLLPPRASL